MGKKQGIFFTIELKAGRIIFKLFSLLPLASVRLKDVEYFRISSRAEYGDCARNGEVVLFWPVWIWGYDRRMSPIYVIKSARDERKFFFRARSGYHYMLRTAIGRAKNNGDTAPSPW